MLVYSEQHAVQCRMSGSETAVSPIPDLCDAGPCPFGEISTQLFDQGQMRGGMFYALTEECAVY